MNANDFLAGGGVVLGITALLEVLKTAKLTKRLVEGNERLLALGMGLIAGAVHYLIHPDKWGSGWTGWLAALAAGFVAALFARETHDAGMNPLLTLFGLRKSKETK